MDSIMKWITSSDIVDWANKDAKDCQENLSLLVRLLIRESISEINSMRFPAGNAIQYNGWDGILDADESVEFIKKGISFWEFGTNADYINKANEDYKKRTFENKGYNIKESVFVFVTPRIWEDNIRTGRQKKQSKVEWINEKKKDDKWSDIIIYDARDLEEWIQKCPSTATWLSNHINKYPPKNVESAIDFWERWIYNPKYKFTSKLVLSGRDNNINKIKNWLDSKQSTYILKSFTKEEAVAFFISTILSLEDSKKQYFLERCLIISDKEVFIKISKIHKYHILINYFNDPDTNDYATYKDNYVFYPITPECTINIPNDELGLLNYHNLSKGLKELGFNDEESYSLVRDSGRSLSVLRRLLNFKQKQPNWIKTENLIYLLTTLLIGKWDDENKNDQEIICKLSGLSYDIITQNLTGITLTEDPPIYNISNKWGLISQYDAWLILAPSLTKQFIDEFFILAYEILSEPDPEYDLDEDERYMAQTKGAIRKYSAWIREGILNAIILLSIYSKNNKKTEFKIMVDEFVKKILYNADEKRWYSVSSILPQLAEASPQIFLEIVSKSLDENNPSILILFRKGKNQLFSRCNYSGLLWALELLAWEPKYLTEITLILSKLAKNEDKESNWVNKPSESLREIYLAWKSNTNATLDERLKSINVLIDKDDNAAFNLLINLMPRNGDISESTYRPKWRKFTEYKSQKRCDNDISDAYSKYFDKLLKISGLDCHRLSQIIIKYSDLSKVDRKKLYEHLENNFDKLNEGKNEIKLALKNLITRHRSFPDATWAMKDDELNLLEKLYNKFPDDTIEDKYKLLFDERLPNLFDANKMNYKEYEERLKHQRIDVVKNLYKSGKLKELISISKNIKESRILGQILSEAEIINEQEEITIIELLGKTDKLFDFAKGYCEFKIWKAYNKWVEKIIKTIKEKKYNLDIVINFLLILYPNDKTWSIVNEFDDEIQKQYWGKCTGFPIDLPPKSLAYGYNKLLEHERYITAINSASLNPQDLSDSLIIEILKKGGTEKAKEPYNYYYEPYNIVELFKELDKRNYNDENVMFDLEWIYKSILSDDLWGRPPKLLHKKMSKNPEFYMKIIKSIFRPENDTDLEKKENEGLSDDSIKNRSEVAFDLLKSFKLIPGQDENDIINFNELKSWVNNVINLSKKDKREKITEYYIGELLSYSITKSMTIPEQICKLLESLQNDIIEEGFFINEINKRGVFTKSMFEGGQQERAIADKYKKMSKTINPKYQRTLKLVEKIVKSYEYDAEIEDKRAEQDKTDY